MTRTLPGQLAVAAALLVTVTACSGSPDLGDAEGSLSEVDGVVDADAAWFDGSWKVADASAVSVAVGADLREDDVAQLSEDLTAAVEGLGWDVEPNLAVELDDDADAVPFLSHFPGDEAASPPTDISTYTVHAANLDQRDVAVDLRFLLHAEEVLDVAVQVAFGDEDVLDAAAEVATTADQSVAMLDRLVADPALTGPARWRISGPDLLLESEAGLSRADATLWSGLVSESATLGGLERTRVSLAVRGDRRLTVVEVTLSAGGPAAAATDAVTAPARQLWQRLERLGVDQVDVVVEGSDETLARAFFENDERDWEPYEGGG